MGSVLPNWWWQIPYLILIFFFQKLSEISEFMIILTNKIQNIKLYWFHFNCFILSTCPHDLSFTSSEKFRVSKLEIYNLWFIIFSAAFNIKEGRALIKYHKLFHLFETTNIFFSWLYVVWHSIGICHCHFKISERWFLLPLQMVWHMLGFCYSGHQWQHPKKLNLGSQHKRKNKNVYN